MAGDVDGVDRALLLVDPELADQVAADMSGRPHQKRHARGPEIPVSLGHQRLLQPPRLEKIAVQRIVRRLQLLVLVHELLRHGEDPLSRCDAGAQFAGRDRLRQKVIGADVESAGHVFLSSLRRQENEVAVLFALDLPKGPAQVGAVHARHHPVAEDDADRPFLQDRKRLVARAGFDDLVAPPFERRGQSAPLCATVIDDEDGPALAGIHRSRLGGVEYRLRVAVRHPASARCVFGSLSSPPSLKIG